jgi:hypothetical protein
MFEWYVQWNGYVPGLFGAVKVTVLPAVALTSNAPPESAVTVWFSPSMFITLTVAPGATLAGTVYLNELMWIMAAAWGIDDIDDIEEEGDVDDIDEVAPVAALGAPAFDCPVPHDVITPSARSPAPAAPAVRASLFVFFVVRWCCS